MKSSNRRQSGDHGRIEFWGYIAWMPRWSIHIAYLIGFRSTAFVLFGWGWSWLNPPAQRQAHHEPVASQGL